MTNFGEPGVNEITITTMKEDQVPAVVDLLLAQERWQHTRDPRLHTRQPREHLGTALTEARGEPKLVALDGQGRVRGFVQAGVWELSEQSILRAFLTALNGITRHLALPDPVEEDAESVLAALLDTLSAWWRSLGTTGDLVRWPSADVWIEPVLLAHGFRLDSVCALRESPLPAQHRLLSETAVREARSDDETMLVGLFEEELYYHVRYTPFVRSSAPVLAAFRRKLGRLWAGQHLEDGAPRVLVAERADEIVGMAETTLLEIDPDDEPGFTPPGRYGCLDNVCVREALRGQGIGHLLVQAVAETFADRSLAGWLLWYNPDNPQAARFWPHMGFVPLWTTYQRLHPGIFS